MENYWHYLTDGGQSNLPQFSKNLSVPASSTVIIGTEEHTVHLGYVMQKDGLLRWFDQHGNLIENVDKWNYLPTDNPVDSFQKTFAKAFVSALDKTGH